jgi:hypothetical protein
LISLVKLLRQMQDVSIAFRAGAWLLPVLSPRPLPCTPGQVTSSH